MGHLLFHPVSSDDVSLHEKLGGREPKGEDGQGKRRNLPSHGKWQSIGECCRAVRLRTEKW